MSKIDLSELQEYVEKINKLANDDKITIEFMEHCLKNLALRTLTRAIKLTPVQTGYLRRGWLLENSATEPTAQEIQNFINDIEVVKSGNEYSITLKNNVEYAVYVNYGHRQEVGKYIPSLGKRLKKGWVDGQFFLEKTEEYINSNKTRIIATEYKNFLRKYFEK